MKSSNENLSLKAAAEGGRGEETRFLPPPVGDSVGTADAESIFLPFLGIPGVEVATPSGALWELELLLFELLLLFLVPISGDSDWMMISLRVLTSDWLRRSLQF